MKEPRTFPVAAVKAWIFHRRSKIPDELRHYFVEKVERRKGLRYSHQALWVV
jgi:hypothetical protein